MKIVLNGVEDLQELVGVLDAEFLRTWSEALGRPQYVGTVDPSDFDLADHTPEGAPTVAPHPEGKTVTSSAGPVDANLAEALGITELASRLDSAGYRWDDRIHSTPAKFNANGTWRARRGVDKDLVAQIEAEQLKAENDAADAGEEPVATETHALPQNSEDPDQVDTVPSSGVAEQVDTVPTVDLAALIAGSQEAAENAPDGTIDLLNRGKDFIKEYGTARFEALKAVVAPLEDGTGKPVPSLTPTERRLLRACMDNYPLYV